MQNEIKKSRIAVRALTDPNDLKKVPIRAMIMVRVRVMVRAIIRVRVRVRVR